MTLPLFSGLLLALSLPPFPTTPLPFLALIPFALHVAGGDRGRWRATRDAGGGVTSVGGGTHAAGAGLCLGALHFALVLHWIPSALPGRWASGVTAFVAAVGVLALVAALAGWALHRAVHGAGAPLWLALPVAWTGAEWLRGSLPGGLAFPWGGIALSLTDVPRALALAAWGGEHAVTFWIVLVNGLLAAAILARSEGRAWKVRAVLAGLVAGTPLLLHSPDEGEREPTLRVAVAQTMLPAASRPDPVLASDASLRALGPLLAGIDAGSVQLIVLPEAAFLVPLESAAGRPYLEALAGHALRVGAPLVTGALTEEEAPRRVFNSVLVVDGRGVVSRYDKRRLVPGFERTPLLPSAALAALGDSASLTAGAALPLLDAGGVALGALVCFESAFGALALEQRGAGARLLVNVTNDVWFGGGFPGAAARAQHEAHLVLRAIETRSPVVRSANGGASLLVEPSGRVTRLASPGAEAVAVVEVHLAGPPSGFLWTRGFPGPACALAASLLTLGAALPPRKRRKIPSREGVSTTSGG